METGIIVLISSNTKQAKIIQKYQSKADPESGIYNHSGVKLETQSGIWIAEESYIKGRKLKAASVLTPYEHYLSGDYGIMELMPLVQPDPDVFEKVVFDNLGIPYDYWSLIHDQVLRTLHRIWVGRKRNAWKKMLCHEFTQYLWNEYNGIFPEYYQGDVSKIYHSPHFKKIIIK